MRKKNKLYTVNKWNGPLFTRDNIFEDGGNLLSWDRLASQAYGANYGDQGYTLDDYMQSKNTFGLSKKDNPFSKGNLGGTLKSGAGLVGSAVGAVGNKILSGGLNSGAGSAISNIGGTIGGAISAVNPVVGGIVSAASGIIGGGVNALFGTKTDQKKLDAANGGTNYLNSFTSNATSFEGINGPDAVADVQNAYKGGLFKKGWAKKKNAELRQQRADAQSWADRSVDNNIGNIAGTQTDNLLANYAACGGPLRGIPSVGTGAIDYGFMSDYLTMRNKATEVKNKIPTNVFGSLQDTPVFALGGDMQTNGADFSDGLSMINAGGSHEENPYQGVQVGISRENGQPNLVEEGETIFDDYVYSKRIKVDAQTKKKFHIGKNTNISYADLSKKLERESQERPNDAISQAGLRKQMHDLAEEQERQKGEEQAQAAQDAFATLPPEQQQAIMQQVAAEEQQTQQQPIQEGQMDEPPVGLQEQQTIDEQMQQQQPEQQQMEEQQMNACGGKLNRFDKGGDMKEKIYGLLGLHTDSDFDKWAFDKKVDRITDWENILKNQQFLDAISGSNPVLRDVIGRGYDLGTYIPKPSKLTFDFTHGGWGQEDYDAWEGSTDAAWKEAVKKGLVKKGMNSEEIGKALSQTDAYKRGTEWLRNSEDNRLLYLQQILASEDAPAAAKEYAKKYVDSEGWLKNAKRDYQTIFEDPNGTGVRNTHPGTYWKTPDEMLRNKQTVNLVMNDNGTIEPIIGDVPKEWNGEGTYSWSDDKNDYTYNYYKRPTETVVTPKGKKEKELTPVHRPTWGRYAGLFGPVAGLGMQALGIGKPDYSGMDASLEIANGSPATAQYKPIGNYLDYRPMDIWYEQNRMNANSRATDRAILNNASPIGTKTAGLLANGYNSQIASGELFRKAQEYNDTQKQRVAEFNRGTDMYNANAFNQTSATNAQIQNNNRQFRAQMQMDAARQRMAADTAWNQGIYGNVQGLFKGLSDWGKENAQHNMIADMAADGLFGTMGDQNIGRGYIVKREPKKAACGGKISRKRKGLTF